MNNQTEKLMKLTIIKKQNQHQLRYEDFDQEFEEYRLRFFENFDSYEKAEERKKFLEENYSDRYQIH